MTSISRAAVGARTCTQPLSELATVSAGYVEVPEPISVRRRCIWGSWHLQTAHTSDHCDLWRCALLAQGQAADKLSTCKQHSRQKDTFSYSTTWPELLLGFCPTSRWCSLHSKAHHNVTKQHERSLPGDATARGRLPSNVPYCCKAAQKRRHYQACSDRNDSPPSWIPRKDAKRGQFIPRAETCKQSFRGAVVVQHTCAQVMLTGVVGGGSQTARRSHLSSHVTVGLEAQQSNQRGHRRGDRRLQRYQQVCQSLATGGGSPPRYSCGLTASEPAARLSVRESSTKENVKSGDVA